MTTVYILFKHPQSTNFHDYVNKQIIDSIFEFIILNIIIIIITLYNYS